MTVRVSNIDCKLAGGVSELTSTTGLGSYSLGGATVKDLITYRTFIDGVGPGERTVYTARMADQFETGIGQVVSGSPPSLTRDIILESSNSNNAVSWGSGNKDIFVDLAAAVAHSLQSQIDTVPVTRTKTTVFTANGTLTTDADCLFAWVRIVGGGGGGGGTQATGGTQHASSSGAGAGEYAEGYFTVAQLGASKSVTIGGGGAGGNDANGSNGGTTNFGSGLLTALGGVGGIRGVASATASTHLGGFGGTGGTGGFLRIPGGSGGNGLVRGGFNVGIGIGGSSVLSGSARVDHDANGQPGLAYGGGGPGITSGINAPARTGGTGAAGVCIVVEYLHP